MKKLSLFILSIYLVFYATDCFAPSIGGGTIGQQVSFVGIPEVSATSVTGNWVHFGSLGLNLPTGIPADNYIIKYDQATKTLNWEADTGGGGGGGDSLWYQNNGTDNVLAPITSSTVSINTVLGSIIYSEDTIGTDNLLTSNTVSFNTIQAPVSANNVLIAGHYFLPPYPPSASLIRGALFADRYGNCSWNSVTLSGGGGGGGGTSYSDAEITFTFDGGGSQIATGSSAWCRVPYNGTISGWDIVAHQSPLSPSFMAVSISTATYANWDTLTDIYTVRKPIYMGDTLTNAYKNTSTDLGGWTTALTKGNYIHAQVVSCNIVTQATVTLIVTRSS